MFIETKSLLTAIRQIKLLQNNNCETYLEKQGKSWFVFYYELTDASSLWD